MEEFLAPLIESLEKFRNKERADWFSGYLKNQFEFLGIDTSVRRSTVKEFVKKADPLSHDELRGISLYLWDLPYREYQLSALDILDLNKKKLHKTDISWVEHLIVTKSWWDTVDALSGWICGEYFRKYPEQILVITGRWLESGNMWLERSCLLFQLRYKKETDTSLLADTIERLSSRKEFFIRKAIGWILRQYSKTNPVWVREFLKTHELAALSRREAEKYL